MMTYRCNLCQRDLQLTAGTTDYDCEMNGVAFHFESPTKLKRVYDPLQGAVHLCLNCWNAVGDLSGAKHVRDYVESWGPDYSADRIPAMLERIGEILRADVAGRNTRQT